jgi:hypothetical protein
MMEVARLLFFFVRAVITVSEARTHVVIKSPKYVTPITVCRTDRAAFERNGIELTMIEKKGKGLTLLNMCVIGLVTLIDNSPANFEVSTT